MVLAESHDPLVKYSGAVFNVKSVVTGRLSTYISAYSTERKLVLACRVVFAAGSVSAWEHLVSWRLATTVAGVISNVRSHGGDVLLVVFLDVRSLALLIVS